MKLNHEMFAQMRKVTKTLLAKGPASATQAIQQALSGLLGGREKEAQPMMRDINAPPDAAAGTARARSAAHGGVTIEADAPGGATFKADTPGSARSGAMPGTRADTPGATRPAPGGATSGADAPQAARPGPARGGATSSTGTSGGAQSGAGAERGASGTAASGSASANGAAPESGARERRQTTPAELAQDFAQELMSKLGVPGVLAQAFKSPAAVPTPPLEPGAQFIAGSYANHAGSRNYKLYIPSCWHGQPMPLLVMLHGCTQNPDDFAAGTQMNAVAEEMQCFVVYPEQAKSANHTKCWNWFSALDQQRDQGESSIIAGIARHVIDTYPVDRRRVYVAGLSAGGAMAIIVGTLYPELFAAVGVHSGLPFASAQDLPSALAAMKSGAAPSAKAARAGAGAGAIPIIVFHGDRDTTVNPRNGEELIAQGLRAHASGAAAPAAAVHSDSVPNGYRYTRTTHHHADGSPLGEHWVIHGAGHAWSGGSAHGSYTDGKGPDASREMMRFFKTIR